MAQRVHNILAGGKALDGGAVYKWSKCKEITPGKRGCSRALQPLIFRYGHERTIDLASARSKEKRRSSIISEADELYTRYIRIGT